MTIFDAHAPISFVSHREKALKNAKRAPVLMTSLGIERSVGVPREHYPNVYDSLATAQMSSSFIAGTKVSQLKSIVYLFLL